MATGNQVARLACGSAALATAIKPCRASNRHGSNQREISSSSSSCCVGPIWANRDDVASQDEDWCVVSQVGLQIIILDSNDVAFRIWKTF